jgi:RHS repeat-associated protein
VAQVVLLDLSPFFEKDSDGTIRKHIFAGANRVCTKGLSPAGGLSLSYYHPDHLGSSNVITDQNGLQVQYCEYTPYGSLARNELANPQTGTPVNHYFTGKELDKTGLYFYGARYYDPELGRFISADTIVQKR